MEYQLSKPSSIIRITATKILEESNLTEASSQKEKAIAVFNFVRDTINFGFSWKFDYATPEDTLRNKRGHCNPQGALFASLCESVGIKARQRFVTIENTVLHGILDGFMPPKLLHSFVEVEIDNNTYQVDGYIVTRKLFENSSNLLKEENKSLGYGISKNGSIDWNAQSNCFVQMTEKPLHDFGAFDKPLSFINSTENFQAFTYIGRLLFSFVVPFLNSRIDNIADTAN